MITCIFIQTKTLHQRTNSYTWLIAILGFLFNSTNLSDYVCPIKCFKFNANLKYILKFICLDLLHSSLFFIY